MEYAARCAASCRISAFLFDACRLHKIKATMDKSSSAPAPMPRHVPLSQKPAALPWLAAGDLFDPGCVAFSAPTSLAAAASSDISLDPYLSFSTAFVLTRKVHAASFSITSAFAFTVTASVVVTTATTAVSLVLPATLIVLSESSDTTPSALSMSWRSAAWTSGSD